ncbi:hypothetical protein M0R89_22820 (plasmid) [Halorussus limi]|uniref:Uncharacterized protein n=1 Tax=Halorussus limi TaxID=2938695 RepID=A0A8U0I1W5_9EURY|nr:hypothetical protein [Halorussus limi]UPV77207.1 hypothetical protein M0R89_22820 [Halorussus limi]
MAITATADDTCLKIDLPSDREYERPEDAELDGALVEAVHRAEDAENEFLAQLLRKELKSHYYETR